MDVESIAVHEVGMALAKCGHLKAYINTNDKTPFTDGYIDVYSGLRQSKSEWLGRVTVQVKGRTVSRAKNRDLKYAISRVDLLAFQKDSGVLYFVVTVDNKTEGHRTHYALLSPFAIQAVLDRADKNQRTIQVRFKEIPSNPSSMESLVGLALKTREQRIEQGFDSVLMERAESITLVTASALDLQRPVTLSPGAEDFALVLHTADGLAVPLGGELRIYPHSYTRQAFDFEVACGLVSYKSGTIVRLSDSAIELDLASGPRLVFTEALGHQSGTISFDLAKNLADRLKTLEFYFSLRETGEIEVNGQTMRFKVTSAINDDDLQQHRAALRELRELMDAMGVDSKHVDVDRISETQMRQLEVMHRALVKGEEISNPELEPCRAYQSVGTGELMVLVSPGKSHERWRLVDPFSPRTRQQFRMTTGEVDKPVPVTAYDIVEPERLARLLNMRLGSIVDAYEVIADFPSTFTLANHRVLALISAFDGGGLLNDGLLEAADQLNEWLITSEGEEPHHLINRWQIEWRRGPLSAATRTQVRALRRKVLNRGIKNAAQLEVGCVLLLGDKDEADELISELTADQLDAFRGWPIWQLRVATGDDRKPE